MKCRIRSLSISQLLSHRMAPIAVEDTVLICHQYFEILAPLSSRISEIGCADTPNNTAMTIHRISRIA